MEEKDGEWIKEEDDIRLLEERDNTTLKIKLKSPIMNLITMREEEEEEVVRGIEEGAKNTSEKSPVSEYAPQQSKKSSQEETREKKSQSSQNLSRMAIGVQEEGIRKREDENGVRNMIKQLESGI